MPIAFIQKISEERDISIRALEDIYEKAKTMTLKKFQEDDPDFYPYVTDMFKNMLGLSSNKKIVDFSKTVPRRIESVSECFAEE